MPEKRMSPIAMAIAISKAWGHRFPVDVREVAIELSKKQPDPIAKIESISIRGAEGMLVRGGGKWGIGFSSFIREQGKVNFTIAHELGHYLNHRHNTDQIICTNDDLVDFSRSSKDAENMEQEANNFASYLLMPIDDFRSQVNGQKTTIALFEHCRTRYDTTLSAAALKLVSFTNKMVVIISSEEGKVLWSRSSRSALRAGLYFKKGALLPDRSQSYKCMNDGTAYNNTQGIAMPSPIWSQDFDAIESVIAQPYYNTVFTVLEYNGTTDKGTDQDDFDSVPDSYDYIRGFSR